MNELAKHIEVLLLENDCVIVPGLGGFIAHSHSSAFHKNTGEFLPPMRSIGFNPQLIMNDGLLVQSYMQAYNTDFPDATRKIETIVEQLKDDLYQKGQVSLENLGTLYYNIKGSYEFEPMSKSFFTPSLYGLESITLQKLETATATVVEDAPQPVQKLIAMPESKQHEPRALKWIRSAVAVAAAVIMFFLMSAPVENTYVDNMGYAALGTSTIFDVIRNESALSFVLPAANNDKNKKQHIRNNVNTLKPVKVKTEKIAAAEVVPTAAPAMVNVSDSIAAPAVPIKEKAAAPQKKVTEKAAPKKEVAEKAIKADAKVSAAPNVSAKKSADKSTNKSGFYIIVASLTSMEDAQKECKKLEKKGFSSTQILAAGENKYRVALEKFNSKDEAYRKIQDLKTQDGFQSAWVFSAK